MFNVFSANVHRTKIEENQSKSLKYTKTYNKNKLITVKGFYDNSLDKRLKDNLLPKKAAVIYIDCDLYKSTVPVLNWIKDFLQRGTIIVFDDWYCFHGDPLKGERLAWSEFLERNPNLRFTEFVETSEAKSFIFLGDNNNQIN